MLYTNFWQNTGIPNQPIYIYGVEREDAPFGEKVGDYCVISADKSRFYRVRYNGACAEYQGFCYYPDQDEEAMLDTDALCQDFIEACEKVFTSGRVYVGYNVIAKNMLEMSERLELGWVSEEWSDRATYEEYTVIYSEEFAKKAHIGQHAIYCYSEEVMHETVQELMGEGYIVEFSSELEECYVMIDAEGNYDVDMAYVVTWEEPNVSTAQRLDQIEQRLIEIDAIWEDRGITDATSEPEWSEYENLSYLQAEILIKEEVK